MRECETLLLGGRTGIFVPADSGNVLRELDEPFVAGCGVQGNQQGLQRKPRFFDMQCTQKGQTTRVKETVTMKGENESHTITASTFDPPMNGVSGMKLVA